MHLQVLNHAIDLLRGFKQTTEQNDVFLESEQKQRRE